MVTRARFPVFPCAVPPPTEAATDAERKNTQILLKKHKDCGILDVYLHFA